MKVPERARFRCEAEPDGYKLTPANKTAESFCLSYGARKLRMGEAAILRIDPTQIEWPDQDDK